MMFVFSLTAPFMTFPQAAIVVQRNYRQYLQRRRDPAKAAAYAQELAMQRAINIQIESPGLLMHI